MKISLPPKSKPDAVARALRMFVDAARMERARHMVEWQYTYWYLQGCRSFRVISYRTGAIQKSFEAPEGQLRFTHEEILTLYQRELGRRMRINTLPSVSAKSLGLDQVRKVAVAQVVLDNKCRDSDPETIKMQVESGLLRYGTMGMKVSIKDRPGKDPATPIEVVYPWELLPVPAIPSEHSQESALIQNRMVALEWLREQDGLKIPATPNDSSYEKESSNGYSKMGARMVPYGQRIHAGEGPADFVGETATTTNYRTTSSSPDNDDTGELYVELTELFVPDDEGRLEAYIVMAGNLVILDKRMKPEERPMMPLHVCRDVDIGGFYGRATMQYLIPYNAEVERMLGNLFKNVQEYDQFGFNLVPATWGIRKEHLQGTVRPRFVPYEPDYSAQTPMRMESVTPHNAGDFPGKVAASARQVMRDLAGDSDLFQGKAPGRVDSASGLGLLYETANIPMIPSTASLAAAYSGCYSAILGAARALLGPTGVLQLAVVDDAIAGVSIDPKTGNIALGDTNPIPDPRDVVIDIKERSPRLLEKRRQELLEVTKMGLGTPENFHWLNYKEQLGFPVEAEGIVQEIRKAMYRNLVQFNDGQTPQHVAGSEHDDHKIQLERIKAFMARVEFTLASREVRIAFEGRKSYHEQQLGVFPSPLPYPEDAAEQEMGPQGPPNPGALGGSPPSAPPPPGGSPMQPPGAAGVAA